MQHPSMSSSPPGYTDKKTAGRETTTAAGGEKATEDHRREEGWKLQRCPAGAIKIWQDASDIYSVLFEYPRIMATLFGVGMPCCLLVLRREGQCVRVFGTQLSYSRWLELWQSKSTGHQIPASRFISSCASLPSSTSIPSTGSSSSRSSSSAASFHSEQSGQLAGVGSSSFWSAEPDITEDLTFLTLDDGAGVSKLHISVITGNKPGEGIALDSSLILATRPDHLCTLASDIDFIFSEHHSPPSLSPPIRRKMEVTIASSFGVPGTCIVEPVPPPVMPDGGADHRTKRVRGAIQASTHATGVQHIGIVHDNMYVNFECKENTLGSILLANEALDVTALGRPHVLAGTQFRMWDTCRKSALGHSLSYKATHIPPIDGASKLEDVGLDASPREYVKSEVAMPVNLKCKSEFLLTGSGLKKHSFEMGRSVGEFQVKVDDKFLHRFRHSRPTLVQAKQTFQVEFIVNHDFDLRMYKNAHLYWLLVGSLEGTPAPHVLDTAP